MILHAILSRDDEGTRLWTVYEASRAKEHAAASLLLYPGRSLPDGTYNKLIGDLRAIRADCNENMLAVRAHHRKIEAEAK